MSVKGFSKKVSVKVLISKFQKSNKNGRYPIKMGDAKNIVYEKLREMRVQVIDDEKI